MKIVRMKTLAPVVLAASFVYTHPALAQQRDPFERLEGINPEVLFKGILREDDVTLLMRHIRESMAASARGEEAQMSESMKQRTEQIRREIGVRGSVLAGMLLSELEQAAKEAIREGIKDAFPKRPAPGSVSQVPKR